MVSDVGLDHQRQRRAWRRCASLRLGVRDDLQLPQLRLGLGRARRVEVDLHLLLVGAAGAERDEVDRVGVDRPPVVGQALDAQLVVVDDRRSGCAPAPARGRAGRARSTVASVCSLSASRSGRRSVIRAVSGSVGARRRRAAPAARAGPARPAGPRSWARAARAAGRARRAAAAGRPRTPAERVAGCQTAAIPVSGAVRRRGRRGGPLGDDGLGRAAAAAAGGGRGGAAARAAAGACGGGARRRRRGLRGGLCGHLRRDRLDVARGLPAEVLAALAEVAVRRILESAALAGPHDVSFFFGAFTRRR